MTKNTKLCAKCSTVKPLDQFNKNKSDGLQVNCRACNAAYREANRESRRIKDRLYREANRDKINKSKRESWNKYKEQNLIKRKLYVESNPEFVKETMRKFHQSPKGRASHINERIKRLELLDSAGKVTKDDINSLLLSTTHCQWCDADLSKPDILTHIDHHIPLSKGGNNTISNLRAICSKCNLSKGAKMPEEFEEYLQKENTTC